MIGLAVWSVMWGDVWGHTLAGPSHISCPLYVRLHYLLACAHEQTGGCRSQVCWLVCGVRCVALCVTSICTIWGKKLGGTCQSSAWWTCLSPVPLHNLPQPHWTDAQCYSVTVLHVTVLQFYSVTTLHENTQILFLTDGVFDTVRSVVVEHYWQLIDTLLSSYKYWVKPSKL